METIKFPEYPMVNNYFSLSGGNIMFKHISIGVTACFFSIVAFINSTYAVSQTDSLKMEQHIEEVKRTHPQEYQKMVERAGGDIVDCLSCHFNLKFKKDPSEPKHPKFPPSR
jgi:hypothetical protein